MAATKAGTDDVEAHTMWHSAAVAWLESGVHFKPADDKARAAVEGLGAVPGL